MAGQCDHSLSPTALADSFERGLTVCFGGFSVGVFDDVRTCLRSNVHGAVRPDDIAIATQLVGCFPPWRKSRSRIDRTATRLIEAIRSNDDRLGGVEDMLREFALSTREGLALMVLAEALLRVPDARTADRFIEDKLGEGDFIHHETKSSAFLVNASAWALGLSARVIQPGETPDGTIGRLVKRLGAPAVRAATRQAMRLMGSHFVLGETIEAALARAQSGARHAILSTCLAKARAPPLMRSVTSTPMPARLRRSAPVPAPVPCPTGRAFRSNSRRCIRVSRL